MIYIFYDPYNESVVNVRLYLHENSIYILILLWSDLLVTECHKHITCTSMYHIYIILGQKST